MGKCPIYIMLWGKSNGGMKCALLSGKGTRSVCGRLLLNLTPVAGNYIRIVFCVMLCPRAVKD